MRVISHIFFSGSFQNGFRFVILLFFLNCEVDLQKSKYMSGKEANERITPRLLAKLQSCGVLKYTYNPNDSNPDPWRRTLSMETSNTFFLIISLITRFEIFPPDAFYRTKDIDRCEQDFDLISCDQVVSAWNQSFNSSAIAANLICKDIKMHKSLFHRGSSEKEE